jgi:hypothetical protein
MGQDVSSLDAESRATDTETSRRPAVLPPAENGEIGGGVQEL